MTAGNDKVTELEALLQRDPELSDRLRSADGHDQARRLIMDAAERHGVTLDGHAVDEWLRLAERRTEVFAALRKLLQNDPSLEPALRQVEGEEAVALIQAAAARQGMTLDAEGLAGFVQFAPQATANQEVDDEQLAAVAGGGGAFRPRTDVNVVKRIPLQRLLSLFGFGGGDGEKAEHSF